MTTDAEITRTGPGPNDIFGNPPATVKVALDNSNALFGIASSVYGDHTTRITALEARSQFFVTSGAPSNGLGKNGDVALDPGNGLIYTKALGAWGTGQAISSTPPEYSDPFILTSVSGAHTFADEATRIRGTGWKLRHLSALTTPAVSGQVTIDFFRDPAHGTGSETSVIGASPKLVLGVGATYNAITTFDNPNLSDDDLVYPKITAGTVAKICIIAAYSK